MPLLPSSRGPGHLLRNEETTFRVSQEAQTSCSFRFKRHGIRRLRSVSEGIQTAILTGKLQISESTHPRGRAGNHKSWNGTTFRYRSSYEKEYAESLDECKIPYFYEKVRIKYFDTQRNKERVAVPDFYLPETKELVEIKSSWTLKGKVQEMKDKLIENKGTTLN